MKYLEMIIETLLSPFSFLLKLSESKPLPASFSKGIVIFLVSVAITALLILYFYRDIIFS